MEESKKSRLKIFLWDQFIRPIYLLGTIHQLQSLLLALLILNFITWKSIIFFWILVILLAIIFIYQMVKYYQSGEFIANYRKFKSERGEYSDYRKLTKVLKKEKERHKQEIIIEDVKGDVKTENRIEENTDYCEKCGKDLEMDNGGNWHCYNCDKKQELGEDYVKE